MTKTSISVALSFCIVPLCDAQTLKTNFAGCTEEKTVFFAYTQTHNNAVELCMLESGYRFSYGPLKKPHVQTFTVGGEIGSIDFGNQPGFAIKIDNSVWWLDIDEYGQHDLVISKPDINGRVEWAIGLESYSWGFQSKMKTWPLPPFAYLE